MWLAQGDFHGALTWFEAAVRRASLCAWPQGHLAEVEAALGELRGSDRRAASAHGVIRRPRLHGIACAYPRRRRSGEEGCAGVAQQDGRRYDELMARHPEAFADHAAEFWLDAADAARAASRR